MEGRVDAIQEINEYFVKVADSCPLAIELKAKEAQAKKHNSKKQ